VTLTTQSPAVAQTAATGTTLVLDTPRKVTRARRDAATALVLRAKEGDEQARAQLLERHRPGVIQLARRHGGRGASLPDLVQEGNLGMLDAIRGFDPERGVTFWTYAHYWVSYRIRQYVLSNRRIVRLPRTRAARRLWGAYGRADRELTAELGRPPTRAEIADRLDVDEADLEEFATFAPTSNDVGIDAENRPDLPAMGASPEEIAEDRETHGHWKETVTEALDHLDEREEHIIRRRFLSPEGASYAALGRQFGISRERVRQLAERGLRKMRHRVEGRLPAELRLAASG